MNAWQAPPLAEWMVTVLLTQHLLKILGAFDRGVNDFTKRYGKGGRSERSLCARRTLRPAHEIYIDETIEIMTPAATAEPITPATFGPMACISR